MTKEIFSLELARKLCAQGFKVVGTRPNGKKPWLTVYEFEATEEFLEAFRKEAEAYASNKS